MKIDLVNSIDEAGLIKGCKNNDPAAQKMLYNKYVEGMMVVCLRYMVNGEDAKEVLMDGFLAFYKNIGKFTWQGEGSTKAWLKRIVINQCLMQLRKRQTAFVTGKEMEHYENPGNSESALDTLSAKEIMNMVHALPDGYRTVFNLYVFEGMNHREIGEMLEISENTSKSQLHRARAILKEKILQTS